MRKWCVSEGVPLKAAECSTFCPANRPAAAFQEKDGAYSIRLDETCGTAGRWNFFYDLPEDLTACSCRLRHNGGKEAVAKALLPCQMSWLDADGINIETSYLEADGADLFCRALRRPAGAVRLLLTAGVRYWGQEVTFREVECRPVTLRDRKVRIVVAKNTPAQGGMATCEDNQSRMESVFIQLEKAGETPDLIVFPETLLTRWVPDPGPEMGTQPIPGPHTDWAAKWAKKLRTNVVISLREKADGKFYNSAAVIDRAGTVVGVYRKTQLTVGEYEGGYHWGDDFPVFDLDFGRIGVLICWDMWFPEAIRTLRLKGAEVVAYPIASTSRKHFDTMWRARAMENGVVLAASISGGDTCPSRIITASGELLAETYTPQTYAAATVDLADLPVYLRYLSVDHGAGESRSFYMQERHPELYGNLSDLSDIN